MSAWKVLAVLGLVAGRSAMGQSVESAIVLAPVDFAPEPALLRVSKVIEADVHDALLKKAKVAIVRRAVVDALIKRMKRREFDLSNEDLARLAEKAGALYALYVSVDLQPEVVEKDKEKDKDKDANKTGPKSVLSFTGRLVRRDGKHMKTTAVSLAAAEGALVETAQTLAQSLFRQLGLTNLPAFGDTDSLAPPPSVFPR